MAKVVCKKCSNEKIVVVNEMIEQPKKEGEWFFVILYTLCLIAFSISLLMFSGEVEYRNPLRHILLGYSLLSLVLIFIFRLLQPFRYKNKTKCICLECGHTWYLGEDNNKSQKL